MIRIAESLPDRSFPGGDSTAASDLFVTSGRVSSLPSSKRRPSTLLITRTPAASSVVIRNLKQQYYGSETDKETSRLSIQNGIAMKLQAEIATLPTSDAWLQDLSAQAHHEATVKAVPVMATQLQASP
jgi:hypothetical protein